MQEQTFHDKLKLKMDEFVHLVYKLTKKFPKDFELRNAYFLLPLIKGRAGWGNF